MHEVEFRLREYAIGRYILILHNIARTNLKARALANRLGINVNTVWRYRRILRDDLQAPPWCLK